MHTYGNSLLIHQDKKLHPSKLSKKRERDDLYSSVIELREWFSVNYKSVRWKCIKSHEKYNHAMNHCNDIKAMNSG